MSDWDDDNDDDDDYDEDAEVMCDNDDGHECDTGSCCCCGGDHCCESSYCSATSAAPPVATVDFLHLKDLEGDLLEMANRLGQCLQYTSTYRCIRILGHSGDHGQPDGKSWKLKSGYVVSTKNKSAGKTVKGTTVHSYDSAIMVSNRLNKMFPHQSHYIDNS